MSRDGQAPLCPLLLPPWVRILALALCVGPVAAQPSDVGIELPPVPNARLTEPDTAFGRARDGRLVPVKAPSPNSATPSHLEVGPLRVHATPGVNLIVEIAIDHLNRILTPFPNPQVRTVSDASTSVDGAAIYVATASEAPVTLFVSDASDPHHALSLTLAPRRLPPREIQLLLSDPLPSTLHSTPPTAPADAAASDYVEGLTEAMRALAQEAIPSGYSLRQAKRGETVTCSQLGLETTRGQVLEGHEMWLVTALARNTSKTPLEIEERACHATVEGETVAVAAWPRVSLEPGEQVELYVAVRPRSPEQRHPERPSLRSGGER
ncbi:TraK domain-containing protein [Thiocystis violacea]|uniref:TraK domain-containing protein n=1 Tax=Thiocystis violacea TaxID=13725 RepID=UPI001906A62E|nr:type-F conjugative transfer system secretin TraK [Thiocystis violacea]MBK1717298.1 hypothetical protein [Thiocystis violacea]